MKRTEFFSILDFVILVLVEIEIEIKIKIIQLT
jgi:hypothetical protein